VKLQRRGVLRKIGNQGAKEANWPQLKITCKQFFDGVDPHKLRAFLLYIRVCELLVQWAAPRASRHHVTKQIHFGPLPPSVLTLTLRSRSGEISADVE
jgi:hypothetical protein